MHWIPRFLAHVNIERVSEQALSPSQAFLAQDVQCFSKTRTHTKEAPTSAHPRTAPTATWPPKLPPLDFLTGIYSI